MPIALKTDVFSSKATQGILAGSAQIVRGKEHFEVKTLEDGEKPSIYTQACLVSQIAQTEQFGKLEKKDDATQLNQVFDHVVKAAKKHNEELTTFARILNITLRIFTLGLWGSNVIDVTPLEASRAKLLTLSQISQTDLDAAKANEGKAKKAQEEAEAAAAADKIRATQLAALNDKLAAALDDLKEIADGNSAPSGKDKAVVEKEIANLKQEKADLSAEAQKALEERQNAIDAAVKAEAKKFENHVAPADLQTKIDDAVKTEAKKFENHVAPADLQTKIDDAVKAEAKKFENHVAPADLQTKIDDAVKAATQANEKVSSDLAEIKQLYSTLIAIPQDDDNKDQRRAAQGALAQKLAALSS